ncbi:MAG: hypothetical protein NTZ16_16390, partial [Verrucomicrobia bacterium]|nr:hypothetical protein [Verrucomicrobiota bacterium]
TDSQGTDLRLFQSIGPELINKVLVAEFEPGLIDAYKGEDKLHALLAYMDKNNFWLSDMTVKGSQRISRSTKNIKLNSFQMKSIRALIKESPGWAEVLYFNTFKQDQLFNLRDLLLGWVFATLQKQHGFALDIAVIGTEKFSDPVFNELEKHSLNMISQGTLNLPSYIIRKSIEKFFR